MKDKVDMADTTAKADSDSDSSGANSSDISGANISDISGANSNGSKSIHWTKKTGARKLQIVKL